MLVEGTYFTYQIIDGHQEIGHERETRLVARGEIGKRVNGTPSAAKQRRRKEYDNRE